MISKEEIYEIADKYLIFNVGNLVGPGEPVFDNKINVWVVPIFHISKVAKFPLGEMVLDSKGNILYVPTTEQLEEVGEKNFQEKIKVKPI
jgi:hypothetical protein